MNVKAFAVAPQAYSACGMSSPCDGDTSGSYKSWCGTSTDCQGQGSWDYCDPDEPPVCPPKVQITVAISDSKRMSSQMLYGYPKELYAEESYTAEALASGSWFVVTVVPESALPGAKPGSFDTERATTQSIQTGCGCYTTEIGSPNEPTGAVKGLEVYQVDGKLRFSWTDNSLCESGFSVTRQKNTAAGIPDPTAPKVAFLPNVVITVPQKCGYHHEHTDVFDDIRAARLELGMSYTYCMSAINAELFNYRSAERCVAATVLFEAQLSGQVTLGSQSSVGSLPVPNVAVSWASASTNINSSTPVLMGTTASDSGGKFNIHILSGQLVSSPEQQFVIQVAKISAGLPHTFGCGAHGATICNGRQSFSLSQLEVSSAAVFVDQTAVQFSGRVFINGTQHDAFPYGCPFQNVSVCLVALTDLSTCVAGPVLTDGAGGFEMPVQVGLQVIVNVSFTGHTFISVPSGNNMNLADDSLLIWTGHETVMTPFYTIQTSSDDEPKGKSPKGGTSGSHSDSKSTGPVYENMYFQSVTTAKLTVEVVGGKCNIDLGQSYITIDRTVCPSWPGIGAGFANAEVIPESSKFKLKVPMSYTVEVPAVALDIKFVENENAPEMAGYFNTEFGSDRTQSVTAADFNAVETNPSAEVAAKNFETAGAADLTVPTDAVSQIAPTNGPPVVRFEYNSPPIIAIAFSGDVARSCREGQDAGNGGYALGSNTVTTATITVSQHFPTGSRTVCNFLPGSELQVYNRLGSELSRVDLEKLQDPTLTEDDIQALTVCQNWCLQKVVTTGGPTNGTSTVTLRLRVGDPEGNEAVMTKADPYTKSFEVKMTLPYNVPVEHKAYVVVTGDVQFTAQESVQTPVYKPLMVVRDPPGGLSTAQYLTFKSTIITTSTVFEAYNGANIKWDIKSTFAKTPTICKPDRENKRPGPYIISFDGGRVGDYKCTKPGYTFTHKESTTGNTALKHRSNLKNDDRSSVTEITWSYTTSDSAGYAGAQSDVFLIPVIDVIFGETISIVYDLKNCKARATTKVQFTNSPDNVDIAYIPVSWVERYEIPALMQLLSDGNLTDDTMIDLFTNALDGWNETLQEYNDVNRKAAKQAKGEPVEGEKLELPTELVPNKLADGKRELNSGTTDPNRSLATINKVVFTGGGAKMTYQVKTGSPTKSTVDVDSGRNRGTYSMSHTQTVGVSYDWTVGGKTGLGFFGTTRGMQTSFASDPQTVTQNHVSTKTTKIGTPATVGFTLGDPDYGDQFGVSIFKDPYYETLVFVTTDGQSKCPHEEGTEARERPGLNIVTQPLGQVWPNEPAVFTLNVINDWRERGHFQLFSFPGTNPGGLEVSVAGDTLPIEYVDVIEKSAAVTTVKIHRGPIEYSYPTKLKLGLRSMCEQLRFGRYGTIDEDKLAQATVELDVGFVRPCSTVTFSGELADQGSFLVNRAVADRKTRPNRIAVIARNPQSATRAWKDDSR